MELVRATKSGTFGSSTGSPMGPSLNYSLDYENKKYRFILIIFGTLIATKSETFVALREVR